MSQNETPKTRGFGPVALIVTGVVCFAGGYMVNDLTKAIGVGVPEMKHGTGAATPSGARDPDPAPAAVETPASEPEKKEEKKSETPEGSAPVGGAGAPPPKG